VTMRRRFNRSRSVTRAPRRRTFWVTNSIPVTVVPTTTQTVTDLLSGTIPGDRDSLRRITVVRMLLRVAVRPVTIQTEIRYSFYVGEVTEDAAVAGVIPDIGQDEVGLYLAQDGIVYTPVAFEPSVHPYDIRSARALRGANRTLVFSLTNDDLTANLSFSASLRLLVAYG